MALRSSSFLCLRSLPSTPSRTFTSSCAVRWALPRPSLVGLPIDIHPEVAQAQAEGRAIVALESTLITHGLPPPHSSSLPLECEQTLRSQSVVPATIAILNGRIKVGLTPSQLDELAEKGFAARSDGGALLWKVGRRELGAAVVKKMDGGTTVSGTMAVAHLAGIKIFSTGGIGGVHRGAETSFDISSDLISLSDTPVAVVCAGSKSILDIGLTLEYLEAHAVPVAAYGTPDWPAFYTPTSGFKAPMQLDGARQVAETIIMTDRLSLPNSLLLGVPIPEQYHAAGHALQVAVEQAVRESVENGMSKSGKEVTPWLLERVGQLTEGSAIISNKALIKNNVKVGGEIAIEYAKLLKKGSSSSYASFSPAFPSVTSSTPGPTPTPTPTQPALTATPAPAMEVAPSPLVVVGSLAIDISMSPTSSSPARTTAPGTVTLSLGGVAGNVAGAAHALGVEEVLLVAPVGEDLLGLVAKNGLKERGMRNDGLVQVGEGGSRTATCGILLDECGELVGGVADMVIASDMEGDKIVDLISRTKAKLVCFDGNLSPSTMTEILKHCEEQGIPTFFEPTSNAQSLKILAAIESPLLTSSSPRSVYPYVTYSTPNIHELSTLHQHIHASENPVYDAGLWFDHINVSADLLARHLPPWVVTEGIAQMAVQLLPVIGALFVKNGNRGVLVVQRVTGVDNVAAWRGEMRNGKGTVVAASSGRADEAVVLRHYPALELQESEVGTVTGAGDSLAGAMLAAMVRGLSSSRPDDLDRIVDLSQRAAVETLKSHEAVGNHSSLLHLLPSA